MYPLKDTLSSDLKADSFDDEAFETGNSLLELEERMRLKSLRGLLMQQAKWKAAYFLFELVLVELSFLSLCEKSSFLFGFR